jgi:prepilin-type N-terminal cleavage/methylation domain-containing protein
MQKSTTAKNHEKGFTLIETIVAVSVLGVLGTLVIPSFVRDARKAKYDSEVNAVFGELLAKEDQHKIEFGAYHAAPQCPAVADDKGTDISACTASGGDWDVIKMNPTLKSLRCTYTVSTGCPSDSMVPPAGVSFNQGVSSWTFVVATCGTGTDSYTYFASSTNPRIQKLKGTIPFTESQSCTTAIASNTAATTGGTSVASSSSSSSSTGTGSTGTGSTGTGSTGTGSTGTGSTGTTGTTGTASTGTTTTTTTTTSGGDGNGKSVVNSGNNMHSNCGGAGKCEQSVGHTM